MENPYVGDTPTQILSRFIRLNTINLTTVSGAHSVFDVSTLLGLSMIRGVLGTFRYFRFKAVEFKIQWSAMAFMYGYFFTSTLPQYLIRNNVSDSYHQQQIGSAVDAQVVDIGNQEDVIAIAPWFTPSQWIDLYNYYEAVEQLKGYNIHIVAPNPALRVTDSTNSSVVTLQIFARFVDPEVSAPRLYYDLTQERVFETQMKGSNRSFLHNVVEAGTMAASAIGVASGLYSKTTGFLNQGMSYDDMASFGGKGGGVSSSVSSTPTSNSSVMENNEFKINPIGSFFKSPDKYSLGNGSINPVPGRQRTNTLRQYLETPTLVLNSTLPLTESETDIYSFPLKVRRGSVYNYSRIAFLGQNFRFWKGSINYELIIFANKFTSGRLNVIITYDSSSGIQQSELIQDVTIMGTTRVAFNVPYLYMTPWMDMTSELSYTNSYPIISVKWLNLPEPVGDISFTLPFCLYQKAGPDFEFRSMRNWQFPKTPDVFETQFRVMDLCKKDIYGNFNVPYQSEIDLTFEEMSKRWSFRNPGLPTGLPLGTVPESYRTLPYMTPVPLAYWNSFTDLAHHKWGGFYDSLSYYFGYFSGSVKYKFVGTSDLESDFSLLMAKLSVDPPTIDSTEGDANIYRTEDGIVSVFIPETRTLEFTCPWVSSVEFASMRTTTPSSDYTSSFYNTNGCHVTMHYPELLTNIEATPLGDLYVSSGSDFCLYYPLPPPPFAVSTKALWPQAATLTVLKHDESISLTQSSDSEKT